VPPIREVFVAKEAVSIFGIEEDTRAHTESVTPLPLRQCLLVIVLGSSLCYGLGFAVVTVFNQLLAVL